MGCRRTPKLYKLNFADGDYEGLEVTLRSLTLGEMRALKPIGAKANDDEDDDEGVVFAMAKMIAKQMVSWNREDENGNPLPPTLESLMDEEPSLINLIVNEWTEAMAGVPAPLEQPSPAGETSQVASIPTEALSPSLAS